MVNRGRFAVAKWYLGAGSQFIPAEVQPSTFLFGCRGKPQVIGDTYCDALWFVEVWVDIPSRSSRNLIFLGHGMAWQWKSQNLGTRAKHACRLMGFLTALVDMAVFLYRSHEQHEELSSSAAEWKKCLIPGGLATCVAWEPRAKKAMPMPLCSASKPRSRMHIEFERRVMIKCHVVFYTLHVTDILLQRSM